MSITPTIFLRSLLAAGACLALASTVAAQPPVDRDPVEMLKRADTDGDGKVNRDEFVKARTADLEAAFGRIDADGDGKIDESEVRAAAERMRSMGQGGREGFRRPEGMRGERPDGERPRRPDGDGQPAQGGEWPQRPGSAAGGEEAFARLDRDGDGKLSREEFAEGMARMREFMQRGGGRPGGSGMPDRGGRSPEEGFRRPPPQE
ncbi:MAG: EF-hand domain-containing protein [Planctomycetia bacterium]